jgi:hypothetical protein
MLTEKGLFPGDSDLNGIIGNVATPTSVGLAIVSANFINPPDKNPLTVGNMQWWIYFGNDGEPTPKNVMVVCGSIDCQTGLDADMQKYAASFDTAIDGIADGTTGNVTCDRPRTLTETDTNTNERVVQRLAFPTTGQVCNNSLVSAIVYYFERDSGL